MESHETTAPQNHSKHLNVFILRGKTWFGSQEKVESKSPSLQFSVIQTRFTTPVGKSGLPQFQVASVQKSALDNSPPQGWGCAAQRAVAGVIETTQKSCVTQMGSHQSGLTVVLSLPTPSQPLVVYHKLQKPVFPHSPSAPQRQQQSLKSSNDPSVVIRIPSGHLHPITSAVPRPTGL